MGSTLMGVIGLVLDSSAIISAERKRQTVTAWIEAILSLHGSLELSLSPVTVAELVHGIYRAQTPEIANRRRQFIEELLDLIPVHPVSSKTAWLVGQIEGEQAAKGIVLPFNDLMIAATALEQDYAVLTGNLRHFQMVPGLTVVPM